MSDRAVQDLVLRALADARFRASPEWHAQALADPARVERFARFLARHFYYERIIHFFKYSRALAPVTGRRPEAVLRGKGFEALLATAVLGSRETARDVAALVGEHVAGGGAAPPVAYLGDLLRYEQAMMIVEAGPRVWREDPRDPGAGSPERLPDGRAERSPPEKVEGTVLLDLAYDLPAVLPQLLQPWNEVPQAPVRQVTLLVARSRHGRVAVARADTAAATVVELADGRKTLDDLAREAGLRPAELATTLAGLTELGAVRFGTGS